MNVAAPFPGFSGVACLAAIARYHGLDLSEAHLLQVASPSPDGRVTPANLAQIANKVGFSARLVHLSWRRLGRLGQALPAILVLRGGEAVVLSGLRESEAGTEVVVRDLREPEQGFQFWDRARLEENWDGQLILLKRNYALSDARPAVRPQVVHPGVSAPAPRPRSTWWWRRSRCTCSRSPRRSSFSS